MVTNDQTILNLSKDYSQTTFRIKIGMKYRQNPIIYGSFRIPAITRRSMRLAGRVV